MKDETKKLKLYTRRALILGGIKVAFLTTTMFRFYYLQVIDGIKYKMLSRKNRIRVIPIFAKRGDILDRNNSIIARNTTTFTLQKMKPEAKEIELLNSILESNTDVITTVNDEKFEYTNLSWDELAKVSTNTRFLPNFEILESNKRIYPHKALIGHISGYVTTDKKHENNTRFGKKIAQENNYSFTKGITGAELSFEEKLHGTHGQKEIEVNSTNKFVRYVNHVKSVDGADVKLSIDTRLHKIADGIIGDRKGCIIVQKISSGEILCLYSKPGYDPNMFIKGFSHEEWQNLQNDSNHPFVNKAISGIFPPASPFKIITSLAALECDIDPDKKVECKGYYMVGSRRFHCWNRAGHGKVDLHTAIKKSCNVYFYKAAEQIGIESIYKAANRLNIIGKTGIELPSESNSFVPNKNWKKKKLKQSWQKGDTINACIGQGYVTLTPIGITSMMARIASGKLVKPSIIYADQNADQSSQYEFKQLNFKENHLKIIRHGMYLATNSRAGSTFSSRLGIDDFELCIKSGTAQVVSLDSQNKLQDHSIAAGFAPYNNPEFAITVIVEHGSWGSKAAAPAAKAMMQRVHEMFVSI